MKKSKEKIKKVTGGSKRDRDYFIENIAILIDSGITITEAVSILADNVTSKQFKKVLLTIESRLDDGMPFYKTLQYAKIVPENMIALIEIGEQSGRLPDNLRLIAKQQQKNREFKSRVISAMLYPLIVLFATFTVGLGVAWFVLPKLAKVFDGLSVELPLVTRIMISIGNFLSVYGLYLMVGFTIFFVLYVSLSAVLKPLKRFNQFIARHLPGIKKLLFEVEVSRFGFIGNSLLSAGLPIDQTIESLVSSTPYFTYKKYYQYLGSSIADGKNLTQAMKENKQTKKYLDGTVQQMIAAGEKSGRLPDVLERVNIIFDSKSEATARNLSIILEPILLFIVWIGVFLVALSVIMPIYGLVGGLEGS